MKNWNEAYKARGIIQTEVADLVSDAVELFKNDSIRKVLDLGCGTGRHTIYLAKNGFEVSGMDVAEEGINITKQRLADEGLKAELKIAEMHSLPYEDNAFDAILAFYVIEHNTLDGLEKTFEEIKRVLKKDGYLIATLITPRDSKNGIGNEIEPGTFINPDDPIESETPHRISDKSEAMRLLSNFEIIRLIETERISVRQNNLKIYRWEIIAKKK